VAGWETGAAEGAARESASGARCLAVSGTGCSADVDPLPRGCHRPREATSGARCQAVSGIGCSAEHADPFPCASHRRRQYRRGVDSRAASRGAAATAAAAGPATAPTPAIPTPAIPIPAIPTPALLGLCRVRPRDALYGGQPRLQQESVGRPGADEESERNAVHLSALHPGGHVARGVSDLDQDGRELGKKGNVVVDAQVEACPLHDVIITNSMVGGIQKEGRGGVVYCPIAVQ